MEVYAWLLDSVGLSAVQAQAIAQLCREEKLLTTADVAQRKKDFSSLVAETDLDEWEATSLFAAIQTLSATPHKPVVSVGPAQALPELLEDWLLINASDSDAQLFENKVEQAQQALDGAEKVLSAMRKLSLSLAAPRTRLDLFLPADASLTVELCAVLRSVCALCAANDPHSLAALHSDSQLLPFVSLALSLLVESRCETALCDIMDALIALTVRHTEIALALGEQRGLCACLSQSLSRYRSQSLSLLEKTLRAIESLSLCAENRELFLLPPAHSQQMQKPHAQIMDTLLRTLQALLHNTSLSHTSLTHPQASSFHHTPLAHNEIALTCEALVSAVAQLCDSSHALSRLSESDQWLRELAHTLSLAVGDSLDALSQRTHTRLVERALSLIRALALTSVCAREGLVSLCVPQTLLSLCDTDTETAQALCVVSVVRATLAAMAALALSVSSHKDGLTQRWLTVLPTQCSLCAVMCEDAESARYALDLLTLILTLAESESDSGTERETESERLAHWLVSLLAAHTRDEQVAVRVLSSLCLTISLDAQRWQRLFLTHASEALPALLAVTQLSHTPPDASSSHTHRTLCELSLRALSLLTVTNTQPISANKKETDEETTSLALCRRLLSLDAVSVAVRALSVHGPHSLQALTHAETSLSALFAQRSAAAANQPETEACETVCALLSDLIPRVREAHSTDPEASTETENNFAQSALDHVLRLFVSLSRSPANLPVLLSLRVSALFADILLCANILSESVCATACEALGALLSVSESVKEHSGRAAKVFAQSGGLRALIDVLSLHAAQSSAVAGHGLFALATLAVRHKSALGAQGACSMVMQICAFYAPENRVCDDAITQLCAAAIFNLATGCAENKAVLLGENALVHLTMLLRNNSLSLTTKHEIKDAINAVKY